MRHIRIGLAALGLALAAQGAGAAGTHGGDGTHTMSAAMKAKHDALEAKLRQTDGFGIKGDMKRATRTVTIDATEIAFNLKAVNVKQGETIRFVLVNKGEQAHELTIGDAAYQDLARTMMTMMSEMDMDPASPEHARMHAPAGNTIIANPGETKELAWTFTKAGTFEFSCNMVGHSEAGMKGAITVAN